MNFRLEIHPALELDTETSTRFLFETKQELVAAKYCAADLLLFLQDKLQVMEDFSNIFICQESIDGEWEEIDTDQETEATTCRCSDWEHGMFKSCCGYSFCPECGKPLTD